MQMEAKNVDDASRMCVVYWGVRTISIPDAPPTEDSNSIVTVVIRDCCAVIQKNCAKRMAPFHLALSFWARREHLRLERGIDDVEYADEGTSGS